MHCLRLKSKRDSGPRGGSNSTTRTYIMEWGAKNFSCIEFPYSTTVAKAKAKAGEKLLVVDVIQSACWGSLKRHCRRVNLLLYLNSILLIFYRTYMMQKLTA